MLGHLLDSVECLIDLLVSFEAEGDGDDTYCEDIHLASTLCHDWSCTSTCAASHTGGNECHASAVRKELLDLFYGLQSCLTAFLRLVAGAESFTHLQFVGDWRVCEGFVVGITEHVGHIVNAFVEHVGNSIAATTADSHHFDDAWIADLEVELDSSSFAIIVVCHNFYILLLALSFIFSFLFYETFERIRYGSEETLKCSRLLWFFGLFRF